MLLPHGNYTRFPVTVPACKLSGDDETTNIQTMLSNAGYTTIHSGKWHLAEKNVGGYDDYDGTVTAVKNTGFTEVASVYYTNMDKNDYNFSHNVEWTVNTSIAKMEEAVAADNPFFLYFAHTIPHAPSNEEALCNFSVKSTPAGWLDEEPATTMPSRQSILDRAYSSDSSWRDTSIGTIWVDDSLGALMTSLEALGVLDNTIIIVTQDHGQLAKNTLYQVIFASLVSLLLCV